MSGGPAKRFYGWRIVTAAFVVLFVGYGLQFSFGVYVVEISEETGWSRRDLLVPYGIYVALYSALSSVSGRATDRWGPRVVVAFGGVALGLGWAGFGLSQSLWQVYLTLGVVAAAGMSATWVPCNATVVRWFVRRRGLAVGIASSGGSAGNLVVPPVAAALVAALGWRGALPVLAAVGAVVMVTCSRFMVRDPERLHLHPDGADAPPSATAHSLADDDSFTLAEARRTATFWYLFTVFALTWLAVFVPFAHLVAFANDLGYQGVDASFTLSAIGLGGVMGRLGAGPFSDVFGRRRTLALMLALQVLSFLAFAATNDLLVLYPAALVFGASYGGSVTLFPALVADHFGRMSAGSIVGTIFAAAGSLAAIGPFVAAVVYDATDSYRMAFVLCAAVNLAALGLVGRVRPPRRRVPAYPAVAPL